jgi:nucleoid-associated protein YgaU
MKLKGFHFTANESGIHETTHDLHDDPPQAKHCILFCDALAIDDSNQVLEISSQEAICSLIKKWIHESLQSSEEKEVSESTLKNAFNYANQRLLQSDVNGINQVAISVTAIASLHTEGEDSQVLIATVGDQRLYEIHEECMNLTVVDPLNKQMTAPLTPEDRLYLLNNAIGICDILEIHFEKMTLKANTIYTSVSYGIYHQCEEKALLESSINPYDLEKGAHKLLSNKKNQGHCLNFDTICTSVAKSVTTPEAAVEPSLPQMTPAVNLAEKPNRSWMGITAAAAAVAIIITATTVSSGKQQKKQAPKEVTLTEAPQASYQPKPITELGTSNSRTSEIKEGAEHSQLVMLTEILEKKESLLQAEQRCRQNLEDDLASSLEKIEYLEKTLHTLENTISSHDDTRQEMEMLKEKLMFMGNADQDNSSKKMRVQSKALEAELLNLQKTVQDKDETILQLERDFVNAARQVTQLKEVMGSDEETMNSEISALQDEVKSLRASTHNQSAIDARAKDAVDTKDEAILALKSQLQKMEMSKHETQSRLEDLAIHAKRVESLLKDEQNARVDVENRLDDLRNSSETANLKSEMKKAQSESESLAKEYDSLSEAHKLQKELQSSLDQELRDTKSAFTTENLRMQELLAELANTQNNYEHESQLRETQEKELRSALELASQQKKWLQQMESSRNVLISEVQGLKSDFQRIAGTSERSPEPSPSYYQVKEMSKPSYSPPSMKTADKVHKVTSGDTLSGLAYLYYGRAREWHHIYERNKEVISDKNNIRVGTQLVIPSVNTSMN